MTITRFAWKRPAGGASGLALCALLGTAIVGAQSSPGTAPGPSATAKRDAPAGAPVRIEPKLTDAASLASQFTLDGNGAWTVRDGVLALEKAGVAGGPIRRPSAVALVSSAPLRDAVLDVEVRSTAALPDKTPQRDVLAIIGYESPTRFYYVHLSAVRDDVHNGIFLVGDADRRRIDTESSRAPLTDQAWHRVRVERNESTGRIAVYWDGASQPIMTATDKTLGPGRAGIGSFDDTGEFRAIRVTGHP